jgi:CRP-like cAMP-binding protein
MGLALTVSDREIVTRINVFRGLNPVMLERLIAPAVVMSVREGETVFQQGEPGAAFFIVLDGWVKLYRIAVSGEEAVINVFAKGDGFAEAVAFTGRPYPATAEAVSPARLVRIPADHIVKCIRDTPEIALAMIASTSIHLHQLVQQVEQLKVQSGIQRVAEFLVSLCESDEGSCTIALPYDKMLIAGRLGLQPESLSRALARLRPAGVAVRASHVVVSDVRKLRSVASGDHRLKPE